MQNSIWKCIIVVWHYQHANTDQIRKVIDAFNWKRAFANKDVNEIVNEIFNETIANILST